MPVARVQGERKEASGAPLEGALLAVKLDRRASAASEDVDDLHEEVALRSGLPARCDLADVHVHEVAAAVRVRVCAERIHARPGSQVEREQIEAEVLVDGN